MNRIGFNLIYQGDALLKDRLLRRSHMGV